MLETPVTETQPFGDLSDAGMVSDFLRAKGLAGSDEIVDIEPLPGGVSGHTYVVRRVSAPDWVVKQALPFLRVATEWPSDPRRIHREAAALRWLGSVLPRESTVAEVYEDPDAHVLVMEAVPQPHETWKSVLLRGEVMDVQVRQFASLLSTIHRSGVDAVDDLADPFSDQSYFEALRLDPYYLYTANVVPEAAAFLTALVDDSRRQRLTMVHGDFSPKNVLVHDGHMVLIDHEVAHIGDPAFDLGFSMAHFLGKAHYLVSSRDAFCQAAAVYWEHYRVATAGLWDAQFEDRVARHALGCSLARASGKSPLEYLSDAQRTRQREIVTGIIADGRTDEVGAVIAMFARGLER